MTPDDPPIETTPEPFEPPHGTDQGADHPPIPVPHGTQPLPNRPRRSPWDDYDPRYTPGSHDSPTDALRQQLDQLMEGRRLTPTAAARYQDLILNGTTTELTEIITHLQHQPEPENWLDQELARIEANADPETQAALDQLNKTDPLPPPNTPPPPHTEHHTQPDPDPHTPPTGDSTWRPINITDIVTGTYQPPTPTIGERSDTLGVFYRGRQHSVYGESESGKSWIVLAIAAQHLQQGDPVAIFDFEDTADSVIHRLMGLGCSPETLIEHLWYSNPQDNAGNPEHRVAILQTLQQHQPILAIIDGVDAALTSAGANPNSTDDVETWLANVPRLIARSPSEPAVVMTDHVAKHTETRARGGIGSQRKLTGIDVAYHAVNVDKMAPGQRGRLDLKIDKDRPGGLRHHAKPGPLPSYLRFTLDATRHQDGVLTPYLDPPPNAPDPHNTRKATRRELITTIIHTLKEHQNSLGTRKIRDETREKLAAHKPPLTASVNEITNALRSDDTPFTKRDDHPKAPWHLDPNAAQQWIPDWQDPE